jgi:hypothetical protein
VVRTMSVAESADLDPVDVNVSSLAVVVKAVSADSGVGVIVPSPMYAAGARVVRRNVPRTSESTSCYRSRSHQKARS